MGSVGKWLGLDKVANALGVIKHNKGIGGTLYSLFRMDVMKQGELVGVDKYGNKYYKNNSYFYASNRWVEYNDKVFMDYDGSQVPAEWHNWLHYVCDDTPIENPRVSYKWMDDHRENLSGTNKAYFPYSTTKANKVESWEPPGEKLKIGSPK